MPDSPIAPQLTGEFLAPRDAVALLELCGILSPARQSPQAWRHELLLGINRLLNASASAAFTLRQIEGEVTVVSMTDAGFESEEHRKALQREFTSAPFSDPFSRAALERFAAQQLDTYTAMRADLVDDGAWNAHVHVLTYRRDSALGDCLLSLHRGPDRSSAYALCMFKAAPNEQTPGSAPAGTDLAAAARFGPRERLLLDTLHRGIEGFYRAEESKRRAQPADDLPPRLRQTLEYLLTGGTERQIALKMSISIHTVHDYVKTLYTYFGVSSRGELLSKWIGSGSLPPPKEKE